MPVNRGGYRQSIGHVDAYPLAFDRLDHRTVNAPIKSPTLRMQPGIERVIHFFSNQMKDFDAVDDFKGKRSAVRNHHGLVVVAWKTRRQRLYVHRSAAVALLPVETALLRGLGAGRSGSTLRCSCFVLPCVQAHAAHDRRSTKAQYPSPRNSVSHVSFPHVRFYFSVCPTCTPLPSGNRPLRSSAKSVRASQ